MNEIDIETIRAETEAITKIAEALSPLTPEGIQKVLRYINHTYQPKGTSQMVSEKSTAYGVTEEKPKYSEFYELFDAAGPKNGPERALVAAYWLQVLQEKEEWDSFQINKELKSLNWASSNITRDLDVLVKRSPRWVHTRKEANSQQARKTYKLTDEGIRAVERLLANRVVENVESNSNF